MTIDEQIAVMQGYKEGKPIEMRAKAIYLNTGWQKISGEPSWNFEKVDYRIAIGSEPAKYVPFSFDDNLVGYAVVRNGERHIVTNQKKDFILVSGYAWTDYERFLKHYTFTDGKPCGKLQTNE